MLKIKDLRKSYKINKKSVFTALSNVSFDINDENMVAIIGESGSGKSTLMNLISTIDTPTGGFVEYDNKKVTFLSDKKRAIHRKDNIGFVFQSFNLISDISVIDNVAIVMEMAGQSKADRYKRANELLELVGLKDHLNKKPGYLSGGQKQRVAIARALANDPSLILADEPTGALDSSTSKEVMKLLATIAATGKKVIIVTHDMKVASYCERIIKMQDGKIIDDSLNNSEKLSTVTLPNPLPKSKGGLGFIGAFKLSSSAFKKRLRRNIMLSLGTAVAISSLLIVNTLTSSIENYFEQLYSYYGNNQVVTLTYFSESMDGSDVGGASDLKLDEYKEIVEYHEIPMYNLEMNGIIKVDGYNGSILPKPTYPNDIPTFGSKDIISGKALSNEDEVVISEEIVGKLGYDNDSIIGEDITLSILIDEKEELRDFTVSGVLTNEGPTNNNNVVYLHNDLFNEYGADTSFSSGQVIVVVEEGKQDEFVKQINFSGSMTETSSGTRMYVYAVRGVEEISSIEMMLEGVNTLFNAVLGVSVFVAAIMIAVMSYVSILERMREIGVLRAIGGRKKDILRMFMIEAVAIGLFSGIFALIIGISASYGLVNVANNMFDFSAFGADLTLKVSFISIIVVLFGSILLAVISSVISIFKGLAIPPVEALKMK